MIIYKKCFQNILSSISVSPLKIEETKVSIVTKAPRKSCFPPRNTVVRGMLGYLLELNRSRPAVQRRIVNLSTRTLPWSRSGEIVSSILPMERPLRESLQASRATFGRVSSCRDRESAPLIITTLEILWARRHPMDHFSRG